MKRFIFFIRLLTTGIFVLHDFGRSVLIIKRQRPDIFKYIYTIAISLRLVNPGGAISQISDQVFFNSINLEYTGLEAVRNALKVQDTTLAKQKLLEYYQNRQTNNYFRLSGSENVPAADDNLERYFTVVNIRKYAGSPDGTIDWNTRDQVSTEWHYQFHRMYWLINLGKAYASTGDEKYAQAWVSHVTDWLHDNAPGYPRTLDTGIRLRNWVESFQYFIHVYKSSSVSAETQVWILKSLMEQCLFLRDNWRDQGNWGADETRGLGAVVTMFPEFKFSPDGNWEWWRDLVISRMQHHLTVDFYSDGVQFETSPAYHSLEYRNIFLTYSLMHLNKIVISDHLIKKFEKPLEFLMHIHKPNKYLPQLSDTDQLSYLNHLEEGAVLFEREDLLYAATRGKEGSPPSETFAAFPAGGYFVMRSDWGEKDDSYENSGYLVFDTGSNEPWHAHYDILNFEAYAYGKTIIKDPGKYEYTDRRLEYYKKSIAHNTIVIDNKDQAQSASGVADLWTTLAGFDYVDAYHDAYSSVKHRRKILFIKPNYWIVSDLITGNGAHTYDLYFHLESAYLNYTTFDPVKLSVKTPFFAIVPADQNANAEIIPGWVSYSVGVEQIAPTIKYSKEGTAPITFETVIYPFVDRSDQLNVHKLPITNAIGLNLIDDEAVALEIGIPGASDLVCFNHSGQDCLKFNDVELSAEVAFLKIDSSAKTISYGVVNGTSLKRSDTTYIDTPNAQSDICWFRNILYVESENLQTARIWAPDARAVIVNGQPVIFVQNSSYVEFGVTSLQGGVNKSWISESGSELYLNYPNPFNNSTHIQFFVPKSGPVKLEVYNILGEVVLTILDREMAAGLHQAGWSGLDSKGRGVPSGIYFSHLKTGQNNRIRRMLLLR